MVYISIGSGCNVKHQIDKHKHKLETLFFDWLITSINSVIEILSCCDISNILYFDNIIRDINHPYHSNNSQIIIKSLNRCNIYNANDTNNTNNILKYEHCFYIKLNINKPQNSDWHTDYLNWTKIFLDIENNI